METYAKGFGLVLAILVGCIQPCLGIRVRRIFHEIVQGQSARANHVVPRHLEHQLLWSPATFSRWTDLVPIKNGKLDGIGVFISSDVEEQLLVPHGVELMSNHSCPKHLLAERDHDERVHVERKAEG